MALPPNLTKSKPAAVAAAVEAAVSAIRVWVSHPIKHLKLGDHQFIDGKLELSDPEAIAAFEAGLVGLSPIIRGHVRELSVSAANEFIAALPKNPEAAKGADSTVNRHGIGAEMALLVKANKDKALESLQAEQEAAAAAALIPPTEVIA